MHRVAVCSYWYPPMQAMGSLRVGKFAKYLPEFGWEPFIFTVAPRSERYTRAGMLPDEGLPGHVSRVNDPSVHAVVDRLWPRADAPWAPPAPAQRSGLLRRAAKRAYGEVLRFPDESWPWLLRYRQVRAAVARVEPHLIFSSSPPATAHLIARRLSADLGVPWVADFRDPWSHNHRLRRSTLFKRAEIRLERRVVRSVTALTTVSPAFRDLLVGLHAKPTFIVPNGFESVDDPLERDLDLDGRVVFTYTGLLYDTSAVPMLCDAIERLLAEARLDAGHVRFRFYGRNQGVAAAALATRPRARAVVDLLGEVSHERALEAQRAASVLLLLEPPEGWAVSLTPGKLFEYVASGRPILATGMPGGEVDRLLRETRTGTLVSSCDALMRGIVDAVERARGGVALAPNANRTAIAAYTRRNVTSRLADVFNGVLRTTGRA